MNVSPASLAVTARMQRVAAHGLIAVRDDGGTTRLDRLYQDGAAKIRMPARDGGPLEAVLINTAGGLTGGDRIAWEVDAAAGASITLTTQACEKIYRAGSGHARASATIRVGAGGRVAWLPQETIVFDRSAFMRTLDVELGEGAQALILEATVFGRAAMGESVTDARFRDRWRVRAGGRLVHAEEFSVGPDVRAALAGPAAAGGGTAVATILLVAGDAAGRLDAVRAVVGEAGGASAWSVGKTGKLLARLVATDGYTLRARLGRLVALLNGQAGLPKIWST